MDVVVRTARQRDVAAMVALIGRRRSAYAAREPVFWRVAAGAVRRTTLFYRLLLLRRSTIALVAERGDGVAGFVIATRTRPPPVYDPGGPTMTIDDFAVADPASWATVGVALLTEVRRIGRAARWRQLILICGVADEAKAAILTDSGLHPVTTWWVGDP